jgi:hypothetical protein
MKEQEEKGLCFICKEAMTAINARLEAGMAVFVCEKCLETTKESFIWICMGCGKVYVRPKSIVLKRLTDARMSAAYRVCEELQIIQGIDRCIECDPEAIMKTVTVARSEDGAGHC